MGSIKRSSGTASSVAFYPLVFLWEITAQSRPLILPRKVQWFMLSFKVTPNTNYTEMVWFTKSNYHEASLHFLHLWWHYNPQGIPPSSLHACIGISKKKHPVNYMWTCINIPSPTYLHITFTPHELESASPSNRIVVNIMLHRILHNSITHQNTSRKRFWWANQQKKLFQIKVKMALGKEGRGLHNVDTCFFFFLKV